MPISHFHLVIQMEPGMRNSEPVQLPGPEASPSAPPSSRLTIALIDRRALERECLARGLLSGQPSLDILDFGTVEEWIRKGSDHDGVSAVLVSLGGQGVDEPSVGAALAALERERAGIPVIVLADREEASQVLMALDRGARGYIPSSIGLRVVMEVVNLVRAGGTYVPASSLIASREIILAPEDCAQDDPLDDLLTPRQAAVAAALRQGKANKIIAYELKLSESTVKVHIRAIMRKLQAHNRTEVAFKLSSLSTAGRATARLFNLPANREGGGANIRLRSLLDPNPEPSPASAYG
ncbi:MAG: response regulator transcription factor [Rhizobiales bacterium]|nr:response regulator transcription factor [Hyphomicrobiales bacterium]